MIADLLAPIGDHFGFRLISEEGVLHAASYADARPRIGVKNTIFIIIFVKKSRL